MMISFKFFKQDYRSRIMNPTLLVTTPLLHHSMFPSFLILPICLSVAEQPCNVDRQMNSCGMFGQCWPPQYGLLGSRRKCKRGSVSTFSNIRIKWDFYHVTTEGDGEVKVIIFLLFYLCWTIGRQSSMLFHHPVV